MTKSHETTSAKMLATRDGFGQGLVEAGQKNDQVVALTADLSESTRAHLFEAKFPQRFFQVGVAEQNLMGVAAGLALSGKVPFIASYAVFSPGRNWEQLRLSVCYSQTNVKIVGGHAGLSVGPDGATHQALEDIAITRCLPNLVVLSPCDAEEARKATLAAAEWSGPVYLRTSREVSPTLTDESTPFEIGQANVMKEGNAVTVVGTGPILSEVMKAAEVLAAENISIEVLNYHTIKPFDHHTLLTSIAKTGRCVTVEDHQVTGGLGSAVAEVLVREKPVPMELVGVEDTFGESGKALELWEKYGLTAPHIVTAVKNVLER